MRVSKKLAFFTIITAFLAIGQILAKDKDGFKFTLKPMHMTVRGNDVHVGDVFKYTEKAKSTNDSLRINYGVSYDPIITSMESGFAPAVVLSYQKGPWKFGASGYLFKTNGSAKGLVATPDPKFGNNAYEFYIHGVRMWGQSIRPTIDQRNESGSSDVEYFADNNLIILPIDFFVERKLVNNRNFSFGLAPGLKVVHFKNNRAEGQKLEAFFAAEFRDGSLFKFFNEISLKSTGNVKMFLYGPSVGFNSEFIVRGFKIKTSFRPAVLFGNSELLGQWDDVDDIVETFQESDKPELKGFVLLDGNFPFDKKERVTVAATDLEFEIVRSLCKYFEIGGGLFVSNYKDMPVAPSWNVPGRWTALAGTGWQKNTSNFSLAGLTLSATVNF